VIAFASSLVGAAGSSVAFVCGIRLAYHCAGVAAFVSEMSAWSTLAADLGRMGLRQKVELDIIALDVFSLATYGGGQTVNAAYRYTKLDRFSRKSLTAGLNFMGGVAGLGGVTKDFTEMLSGERDPSEWAYCPDGSPIGQEGRILM
jgi:hypothetical protein